MKFNRILTFTLTLLACALAARAAEQSGDNLVGKSLRLRFGNTASNVTVGGVAWLDTTQYTNCCSAIATTTNMAQYTLPADALNASGDTVRFIASGTAASISNRLQLVFGSETILDSGSLVNTGTRGDWTIRGQITRTGATAQHAQASLIWGGTQPMTNASLFLAQTCSVATVLKTMGGSSTNATLTNQIFLIEYVPAFNGN